MKLVQTELREREEGRRGGQTRERGSEGGRERERDVYIHIYVCMYIIYYICLYTIYVIYILC